MTTALTAFPVPRRLRLLGCGYVVEWAVLQPIHLIDSEQGEFRDQFRIEVGGARRANCDSKTAEALDARAEE